MLGSYENIDRFKKEPNLEPVDAVMMTLDAETYLEKTLDAMYREVPIKQLFVIDGGSKDKNDITIRKIPSSTYRNNPGYYYWQRMGNTF
jgi:hypothetical protein